MASEDSDQLVPGFLPIHGLNDFRDLDETFGRLVPACGNEFNAASELLEVLLLWASHRMLSEERNDRLQQITTSSHGVAKHVLAVVVVSPVRHDNTNAEELTKSIRGTQRLTRLA